MCFRFDSCFGVVPVQEDGDYHRPSRASKGVPPPPHHVAPGTTMTTPPPAQRNGYYNNNGNGHHAAAYHRHRGPVDEAGRKASYDAAMRGPAATAPIVAGRAAAATRGGGHGYAQEKAHAYTAAGADEALKHPAAAKVVARGAGNGAQQYYHYEHEQPARKEDTKDYYYPTATATSDHQR